MLYPLSYGGERFYEDTTFGAVNSDGTSASFSADIFDNLLQGFALHLVTWIQLAVFGKPVFISHQGQGQKLAI
jgi:hypothetical protein